LKTVEIDVQQRQKVMARSRRLGHCICNPQQGCPCPPLIEQNVCPCAGERLPAKTGRVALTRYVRKAGCASKIGQADLLRVLGNLPPVNDPRVLVGTAAGDDAGIYQIDDHRALVQTVDVFTPCVDDPYLFGQIAAANSVSDVYAMGGAPITALSIIGFPIETLDSAIMEAMLRGGCDKLAEAGCCVIGGHSINDGEVKCGFAVTGLIDLERVVARDAARPGDVLVLTKPLGTGLVCFAGQLGLVRQTILNEVGASMAELNKDAAELMVRHGAHACTDITGFGLAGHLAAMARGSGVVIEIDLASLPVFAMADECLRNQVIPGAVDRNQAYAMAWTRLPEDADEASLAVLFDPQTSGGLLVALPPAPAEAFLEEIRRRGHSDVGVVGRVTGASRAPHVVVRGTQLRTFVGARDPIEVSAIPAVASPPRAGPVAPEVSACCGDAVETSCCDSLPGPEEGVKTVEALDMFKEFMKEANKPGRIDQRAKKLMAIALSIAQRCKPCLTVHLQGAVQMGISKEEIDEAANLAIAFGGCTAMMFYKEVCEELKI
jgi:selenide,water dikinase